MLAKIIRGRDFAGLHRYLTGAAKMLGAEDIEIRNLVSIETAVAEMVVAASRSKRTEKPVYHIPVAWAENEHPTRDQQFAMGHALIERIGLSDHQAVLVRHPEPKGGAVPGAGRHYELHIELNRIGPDGRAAPMAHDYAVIERAVAAIAAEQGMRVIPGRHNGIAGDGIFQGGSGAARSFTAATGELTAAARLRADPSTMQRLMAARARGWPALLQAFEDAGVRVTTSSRIAKAGQSAGLVLVPLDGSTKGEKISALDGHGIKWGRPTLEAELGPVGPHLGTTQSSPKQAPAQQASPPRTQTFEAFQAARSAALSDRRAIGDRHRRVLREMTERQGKVRRAAEAAATRRRQLVRAFFGRRSDYGTALNTVCDHRADTRLAALRVAHHAERQALVDAQRKELAGKPIPAWCDWQRRGGDGWEIGAEPQRPSSMQHAPAPDASPKMVDPSPRPEAALLRLRIEEELRYARLARRRRSSERKDRLIEFPVVCLAADIVKSFVERRLSLRATIAIVSVLAATHMLAPLLVMSAAVQVVRHGLLAQSRASMRTDVDAASAARSGFRFDQIPRDDRVHYGRLAASDLFTDGGPSAAPILAVLDQSSVARFAVWYVHASDKQRGIVRSWTTSAAAKQKRGSANTASRAQNRGNVRRRSGRGRGDDRGR